MPEPDPHPETATPQDTPAFQADQADRALRGIRPRPTEPRGLLGGMRIRKKLIVLHTCFSLGLAAILLLALRPAITDVLHQAEVNQARVAIRVLLASAASNAATHEPDPAVLSALGPNVALRPLDPDSDAVAQEHLQAARQSPGEPVIIPPLGDAAAALAYVPGPTPDEGRYWVAGIRIQEARAAVVRIYLLMTFALLAVYALVAASLEIFVLPQHVYAPIRRMLRADHAVQHGDKEAEIIPEAAIPADELGEIMRSRNASIVALRRHETALAEALAKLEQVANDLKRKNHLLEAAQRNLADADRLASLGMMSAGIAHELNTPLAVLKGLVEKLNQAPRAGIDPAQAALMLRVVRRLERLGESLLDFARVRPPQTAPVRLHTLAEEALTLVRLDREAGDVEYSNTIPEGLVVECDADRMVQVLVNLLRNATDAVRARAAASAPLPAAPAANGLRRAAGLVLRRDPEPPPADAPFTGRVAIHAEIAERQGRRWVSLTITDNGQGINPDVLSTLFEPFVSTRLDARGTGLGLAVADGIVREHGGLTLARNRTDAPGAVFEVMLPLAGPGYAEPAPGGRERPPALA